MNKSMFSLGIDLGTSGIKIAIIDKAFSLIYSDSKDYIINLRNIANWKDSCRFLLKKIPLEIKKRLVSCSIDGTSGTLIACNRNGIEIGDALPYYISNEARKAILLRSFPSQKDNLNLFSSITRAMELINSYGEDILLRHQADWITGWLINNWEFGEEGNNIRLGWNLLTKTWLPLVKELSLQSKLPKIIPSGTNLGLISKKIAKELCLPDNLEIIAGTTDSNAAVIATNAKADEGITVLGSTIVIKRFVERPIEGPGITNHLVAGQWISGGASNAGGAVLRKFFSNKAIKELSNQIDPEIKSGLNFIPLPSRGERFPINDPQLEPILNPRPTSDSLYLHGLLEGLATIEAKGWEKLDELGAKKPNKIITIGGGANNPQWRRIREKLIGIPIKTSKKQPAEGVARIAIEAML